MLGGKVEHLGFRAWGRVVGLGFWVSAYCTGAVKHHANYSARTWVLSSQDFGYCDYLKVFGYCD